MKTTAEPLAGRIARAALSLNYRSLTALRQERLRRSLIDFLGCAIGSAARPELEPALLLAHDGDVAVPGQDRRFDPASAAMVYGMAGALFQLHDVYVLGGLHPSSAVIPAAHAIRQIKGASKDVYFSAVAAGYEVTNRLAGWAYPHQQNAGITPTAAMGAVGAVVSAGLLLGLDAEKLEMAVGNITLFAPLAPFQTLREHGSAVPIHGGLAARAGVEAALLAAKGWSAGAHALEGSPDLPGWLLPVYGDWTSLAPETWDGGTLDHLAWKLFPACFGSHATLEAALKLPKVDWRQIESVEIGLPTASAFLVGQGPIAGNGFYDRIMSVRWAVARALIDGKFGIATLASSEDDDVDPLMARIKTIHDPALNASSYVAADLRITMKDGVLHQVAYRRDPFDPACDRNLSGWIHGIDAGILDAKFTALTESNAELARTLRAEIEN